MVKHPLKTFSKPCIRTHHRVRQTFYLKNVPFITLIFFIRSAPLKLRTRPKVCSIVLSLCAIFPPRIHRLKTSRKITRHILDVFLHELRGNRRRVVKRCRTYAASMQPERQKLDYVHVTVERRRRRVRRRNAIWLNWIVAANESFWRLFAFGYRSKTLIR